MMKKLFIALFGIMVSVSAQAQITITRADLPDPNMSSNDKLPDSVMYTIVNVGTANSYQNTGVSITWNETNLGGTQAYRRFLPVSATPYNIQGIFLSGHAIAVKQGETFVGGTLNDAFEFYSYSGNSTQLNIKGIVGRLNLPGIPTPLTLKAVNATPDVLFTLPMNYGNKDSSNSGFSVTIPTAGLSLPNPVGDIIIKRSQKRVNEVDGWGTLTLPNGMSYNVLRHVSKVDRIDSLINDISAQAFPSQFIEYRWMGLQRRMPVMQINGTLNNGQMTITEMTMLGIVTPASVNNLNDYLPIKVYPNPASDVLYVDCPNATGDWQVQLVDMMGRRCAQFHFSAGNAVETIPVQGLIAGQYVLYVQSEGKTNTRLVNIGSR